VVGVPLRILGGMIKTITIPLEYLGNTLGWMINKIAGALSIIPEFILPKGLEGIKSKIAAGAMSVSLAATPAFAAHTPTVIEKPDILQSTRLLAARNTNYYQTFNNQRMENNNVIPPPTVVSDQRPIEVKLHLDGREIHRSVIEQERGQEVRSSG
jgi:hypothetical protein